MNRFVLSRHAQRDLEEIRAYSQSKPRKSHLKIGRALQKTLRSIAGAPFLGTVQSEFTRLAGTEIRSRLVDPYRIFYTVGAPTPEILAILHSARDIHSIMTVRLQ
jgi:plasmid stabilization system protein ParE